MVKATVLNTVTNFLVVYLPNEVHKDECFLGKEEETSSILVLGSNAGVALIGRAPHL